MSKNTNVLSRFFASLRMTDVAQLDKCTRTVQKKVIELASISLGRESDAPGVDEPLYGTETGFDSIALLEFILRLEDEFEISIPDEDLDPEIFRSINTIVSYVIRRLFDLQETS